MRTIGVGDAENFGYVARALHAASDECGQLQAAVDLSVRLVAGCDHAGVSMVQGRGVSTPAGSAELVRHADALQYELDEGPCLDSLHRHQIVLSQDLSQEERWPRWTPRARTDLGIQGMLSLWLWANTASYGALNLYADQTEASKPQGYAIAQAIAAQLSVALAAQREIQHRSVAMMNRTIIGQVVGILMERLGLDPR